MTDAPITGIDPARVAERLAGVRERIARAGGTGVHVVGRHEDVGHRGRARRSAAGCDAIGENYAQEMVAKLTGSGRPAARALHRQLQTNKVRQVAPFVDVYETVDRRRWHASWRQRVPGARVLVQVSPDGEPGKGGCPLDAAALVDECLALGLQVEGLMTVGPTEGGPEAARPGFRAVRAVLDELGLACVRWG
jgi:uncharacterized pyridoxal phosphate-containing UPF0001 family protein